MRRIDPLYLPTFLHTFGADHESHQSGKNEQRQYPSPPPRLVLYNDVSPEFFLAPFLLSRCG